MREWERSGPEPKPNSCEEGQQCRETKVEGRTIANCDGSEVSDERGVGKGETHSDDSAWIRRSQPASSGALISHRLAPRQNDSHRKHQDGSEGD